MNGTQRRMLVNPWRMHYTCCSIPKGNSWAEAMSNSEKIKLVALAIVQLCLTELRQSVENSIECIIFRILYHELQLVVHSRDVEDCRGAPRRKLILKPAKIPYITMWQYWLGYWNKLEKCMTLDHSETIEIISYFTIWCGIHSRDATILIVSLWS